jgi:hypothetical protein
MRYFVIKKKTDNEDKQQEEREDSPTRGPISFFNKINPTPSWLNKIIQYKNNRT